MLDWRPMARSPATVPAAKAVPADPLPFKYVGGDVSADFVNTVDWAPDGLLRERLTDYERLTRWTEGAGLVSRQAAQRLRRLARARPQAAAAVHASALRLRAVLQRLCAAVAAGERASASWDELNAELATALAWLRVSPRPSRRTGSPVAAWGWRERGERLDSPLWPVVWSAAWLLTSDDASRIRVCAGPDCGWVYVDRSRNGLRRWCEMETCGTAEKSRRRREKR